MTYADLREQSTEELKMLLSEAQEELYELRENLQEDVYNGYTTDTYYLNESDQDQDETLNRVISKITRELERRGKHV